MTSGGAGARLTAEERRAIGPALANATRRDAAMYAQLLKQLFDANRVDLAGLRRAIARRDWPAVHHSVHRIKGSAALARCTSLVASGKSLESAAAQGNAAVVNALLPRYAAMVTEFNDTLSDLLGRANPDRVP